MKIFLAFIVALFSVASTSYVLAGTVDTGISTQYRDDDNNGNYKWGYDEQHASGGSFRHETNDGRGGVSGSYGIIDADGRRRVVRYIADAAGFRAHIETNEPGVGNENPASVNIQKEQTTANAVPVALAPIALAPVAPVHRSTLPTPIEQQNIVQQELDYGQRQPGYEQQQQSDYGEPESNRGQQDYHGQAHYEPISILSQVHHLPLHRSAPAHAAWPAPFAYQSPPTTGGESLGIERLDSHSALTSPLPRYSSLGGVSSAYSRQSGHHSVLTTRVHGAWTPRPVFHPVRIY